MIAMKSIGLQIVLLGLLGLCAIPATVVAVPLPGPADFDAWCRELDSDAAAGGAILLNRAIGPELDGTERARYHLLPGLAGFESARLTRGATATIRLDYRYGDHRQGTLTLSNETLRLTRLHIWLSDLFLAGLRIGDPLQDGGDALRYTALRFATQARYDLAIVILEDLAVHYADTEAAVWAISLLPDIRAIQSDHRTLIWDQIAGLGSGSNDLRFFGSYYGLWMGFALPLALGADSPEPYGLGLLLGGPGGYFLADRVARSIPISEGRATMLSLGANFGTWQGLGWAAHQDADSRDVFGSGIVSGLGGLGAAILLTQAYDFSEGHAALTESAMNWGGWYGMVYAGMVDNNGDSQFRRNALVGSAVGVGLTGLAARHVRMSEGQVRLISLKGVLGSVMACGVALIAQPDDGSVAWGIIGAGGAAGLVLGFRNALSQDRSALAAANDTTRGSGPGLPQLMVRADPGRPGRSLAALGYRLGF